MSAVSSGWGRTLAWCALAALLPAMGALADVSRCSDRQVEFLVGGAGKSGGGRTCAAVVGGAAPVASRAGAASRPAGPGPVMKMDDAGRREILQQELQKERLALAELEKTRTPTPGAGTFDEQRNRRLADIVGLESELRRTPGP